MGILFFRSYWKQKDGDEFSLLFATEYDGRLDYWGKNQSWILSDLQKYFDSGWEAVGNVGPEKGLFRRPPKKERLVFYESLKYERYDRSGKLYEDGVFFTTKEDEIKVMYKSRPGRDGKIIVTGNDLDILRDHPDYKKTKRV